MSRRPLVTIIVLVPPNRAVIDEALLEASAKGQETPVVLGQQIGTTIS